MKISRKSNGGAARRARLAAYMATGVGAIGLGTSSQAAVVSIDLTGYTGDNMGIAPGPGAYPTGRLTINNFGGSGTKLIAFNNVYGNYTGLSVQSMAGGSTPVGTLITTGSGSNDTPINVGAGVAVGPSSGYFAEGYSSTVFKNSLRSAPDFGPNSFIGFRTVAGQYGYIEVLWTASTSTFKLVSAAYESTPGVAIQTPGGGGGGAVPEPASGAVVALLMGGTALRQWRKKRRDQETACDESLAS